MDNNIAYRKAKMFTFVYPRSTFNIKKTQSETKTTFLLIFHKTTERDYERSIRRAWD